jgi:flagellar basal body-associated protein FliL
VELLVMRLLMLLLVVVVLLAAVVVVGKFWRLLLFAIAAENKESGWGTGIVTGMVVLLIGECWTNMKTRTKRTRGTENPDAFIRLNIEYD